MNRSGARAEALCVERMRRAGLRIVARNWRCRFGEIDIVAEDAGVTVFAEVRLRRAGHFGGAAESITVHKRARLIAAAQHYLAGRRERHCRFDVMLLETTDPDRIEDIEWIRNAFDG